jgi:small subunit ribosomal protein S8
MNIALIKILLQIKNASIVKKKYIEVVVNKKSIIIIKILYKNGFLQSYIKKNNKIRIYLKYIFNKSLINNLKIISKPSISYYLDYKSLCRLSTLNLNLGILSTSFGVLTSIECKKKKIGGKLLFIC